VRLAQLRDASKLLEAQRLEQRTMFDMEMMQEVGYCAGIETIRAICPAGSRGAATLPVRLSAERVAADRR